MLALCEQLRLPPLLPGGQFCQQALRQLALGCIGRGVLWLPAGPLLPLLLPFLLLSLLRLLFSCRVLAAWGPCCRRHHIRCCLCLPLLLLLLALSSVQLIQLAGLQVPAKDAVPAA